MEGIGSVSAALYIVGASLENIERLGFLMINDLVRGPGASAAFLVLLATLVF